MPKAPKGNDKEGKAGRDLVKRAFDRLEAAAGVKAHPVCWEPLGQQGRADAKVDFKTLLKPHWVQVRGELTPARLGAVLDAANNLPKPNILITPYITPPMAHRLREAGVQFLDGEGNAYLEQKVPRFLVWVTGHRPAKRQPGERPLTVFRAAGLRVIFPFLCLPDTAEATYRDLARMAGVALGTVAKTIEELEHLGYLRKAKNRLVLERREKLLDAWVDAYPRELRPLMEPRRFRTDKAEWWKGADWQLLGAWLGGEPAAALLTKHLRPVVATAYLAGGLPEIARALRLAKDEQGNVEVLQKFWFFDKAVLPTGPRLVPPLLVYADLLATGDARNIETAAIIRERYLD